MATKRKITNEQQIKVVPKTKPEIGIDTEKSILSNIIDAAQVGTLDLSSIDALSNTAQTREQLYETLDSMAQDDIVSSVLEVYTEDSVQTNDKGKSIWADSSDSNVLNYVTWLMDSLNIDKHLSQWTYCLCTYGDVYIRLYRQSDYGDDLLFKNKKNNKTLNEDVKLKIYGNDDPYIPYVEMIPNPGEVFDLQKFGKTHGFIKAPINRIQHSNDELYSYLTHYQMKEKDVEIYDATSFAHGCLDNTTQRQPETVDIFLEDRDSEGENAIQNTTSYSVKRGQSLLYNSFKIWRELSLLEMSALLNRLTKSSIVRVLNVDVGDMPKEQVQVFIQRLKEKIEQKSALSTGQSFAEYTNPGPIENTIYVPTHGGQGTITATTIGGDFDPKSLVDLEYFRDKLFGSLKVPKQFFGFTEDGAGFNGGSSLTILSSRYGKSINKIQNVLCQLVTDIINLFLIDRGLDNYVNKFIIRMQAPTTQEELDRRTNTDNRIRYVGDVMQQLEGLIDDKTTKLNIYKSLIGTSVNDPEVMSHLQSYIDGLNLPEKQDSDNSDSEVPTDDSESDDLNIEEESFTTDNNTKEILVEEEDTEEDSYLPSPADLDLDLLDKEIK